jgi:serine/threonine protein kinase
MTGGGAFVALKWMEGRTLQDLLDEGVSFTPEQTARLVKDMRDISDVLVEAKIVHRDVRPANLMVSPDGRVRIFDFQFAVDRDDPREQKYFVDRYMELLWVLGDTYADGHGKWNDRRAMVRCLEKLPECPERAEAIEYLSRDADAHNRTVNLPKGLRGKYMGEYKWLESRRRRHKWLMRKDKPDDVRRWKFLKYVLFEWGEF